ncbi:MULTISPECIES: major capsid protein [unclassified Vibrio]|uniref:major capsid protein n=1 Tax=unclassified Vibrio TaxID=2614977 RepID=UPI001361B462|nr:MULTISPECIES: major capsid protein [unclassified Vibrio]NAW56999.1 phage capsid protein [Vibrio sp. V36_P2S2PM302]NAX21000.1 phage capsid protein [Vibrio sp. V39_P1S14PM300]NAX27631.1 phage capsid protein [Vibrio sp. V38_P2S17PM301]NAX29399.1 phage capsid protein [Vibrio sp. V37_P2S8PM304]
MPDNYTTRELLGAIQQAGIRRDNFFMRFFFREMYTFNTEKVDLDMIPNKTKIAAYCSPMIGAAIDRNQGFKTSSFKPAYVKSKHAVTANQSVKRRPGEPMKGAMSAGDRQNAIVMQNLDIEEQAVRDREELMCAEMVYDGKTVIDSPYIDQPYEIDAGRNPDNNITLIGAALWTNQDRKTYDIVADIEKWAAESEGLTNVVIADPKTWALMREFTTFNDKVETRRGSKSQLETALKDLGATVSIKGNLGDVTIVVVDEEYIDRAGVTQKVQRDYHLILAHTAVRGARLYGQIQDQAAQREGFDEAERYVKDWTEGGDPEVRYTKTESAPAMYLIDVNKVVVVKVA